MRLQKNGTLKDTRSDGINETEEGLKEETGQEKRIELPEGRG